MCSICCSWVAGGCLWIGCLWTGLWFVGAVVLCCVLWIMVSKVGSDK